MNYFEHHIGDYDQATAHLSGVEDGIYHRLIRRYMATERPLPADVPALQRLVRAHSRDEKKAVQTVLAEFFELREDGYHQHRCDEEIARFQEKSAKAKKSAEARWGQQRPDANADANASVKHDASDMRSHSEGNAPRARPQTPDTNLHTPVTPHSPPEGGGAPSPKRKRTKAAESTLAEWLSAIQAAGEKAIPNTDAVFGYARDIGLPAEFLHYAWFEFKARYTADPVKGQRQKTYADWRAVFRKAVREGWLKLWYLDGQQYALTAAGQQAQRAVQAQQQREGGDA